MLIAVHIDVFDHLNEGAGHNDGNITEELEKQLAHKKKLRAHLKQQMLTEQSKVFQFFGGLQLNHFIFLMVLGALTAITAYALDVAVFEINSRKIIN